MTTKRILPGQIVELVGKRALGFWDFLLGVLGLDRLLTRYQGPQLQAFCFYRRSVFAINRKI